MRSVDLGYVSCEPFVPRGGSENKRSTLLILNPNTGTFLISGPEDKEYGQEQDEIVLVIDQESM